MLLIHKEKLLQLFSLHPTAQQVSPCCHSFLKVPQYYHSKVTPIGALHAKKIAKSVLLYVFRIAFLSSLVIIKLQDHLITVWLYQK